MSKARSQDSAHHAKSIYAGALQVTQQFRLEFIKLLALLILSSTLEGVGLALVPTVLTVLTAEKSESGISRLIQPLINTLTPSSIALFVTAIVALLFILKHVVSIITSGYSVVIVNRMRDQWRSLIMSRYLKAPLGETRDQQAGRLIENLVSQPIRAAKFMRFFLGMCADCIASIVLLIVLLVTSWKITLIVGGCFFAVALFGIVPLRRQSSRLGVHENRLLHELTQTAAEAINGLQQIKIFGLEREWHSQFLATSHEQSRYSLRSALLSESPNLIGALTLAIMILAVVAYSSGSGGSTLAVVVLTILVGQRLHGAISGLLRNYANMRNLKPSFDLVRTLTEHSPPLGIKNYKYSGPLDEIRFENVSFRYERRASILTNINFTLRPGKITALVGPSGSGKSTVVNLMCGLLMPGEGRVLINGRSLAEIDPSSWLSRISIVSQDNFLFHDSVRRNLLVGDPCADDRDLRRAAEAAGADGFVSCLPASYDTVIGDRGASLSGGQIQRLAIARALLRDGDLIIFDEATSALDEDAHQHVLSTLHNLACAGKVVLLISHRTDIRDHADFCIDLSNVSMFNLSPKP
jgi:subfamily B ATP-binding cassette protein MsbA